MTKKYAFTKETKIVGNNVTVRRIKSVCEFTDGSGCVIPAGELGGFIESESNLSQEDGCWVDKCACVYENAHVQDDAVVAVGHICGDSWVCGKAVFAEDVCVNGNAIITALPKEEDDVCKD